MTDHTAVTKVLDQMSVINGTDLSRFSLVHLESTSLRS